MVSPLEWLSAESKLSSLLHSSTSAKVLCAQRFVRTFAFAAPSLVLVLYLQALNNSKQRIGLFMTLTVLGDAALSLTLTLLADRLGRKNVLMLGSLLMMASGTVFALCKAYLVLLLAAILGVISPRWVARLLQLIHS